MPDLPNQTLGELVARVPREALLRAKQMGFSDVQLARLWHTDAATVRALRKRLGVEATFKTVDTCAAEFEAHTPYHYSTYEQECEVVRSPKKKIMILGGGPNRIGQGIEFDYCCCHASFALREDGYETIMVNSNPETVSTDYDTSDKLYFEPLTVEDVLAICDRERPDGVIVQFGGQTPLKLAVPLERAGVNIVGTSPAMIDVAEDRKLFGELVSRLDILQPENGTASSEADAIAVAAGLGYPVHADDGILVRMLRQQRELRVESDAGHIRGDRPGTRFRFRIEAGQVRRPTGQPDTDHRFGFRLGRRRGRLSGRQRPKTQCGWVGKVYSDFDCEAWCSQEYSC